VAELERLDQLRVLDDRERALAADDPLRERVLQPVVIDRRPLLLEKNG
jgi:hypothetical protein